LTHNRSPTNPIKRCHRFGRLCSVDQHNCATIQDAALPRRLNSRRMQRTDRLPDDLVSPLKQIA
ncbi:MAG TPA: hypothetical protein VGG60_11725, partial [Candidatus Binataceae bacterium]